MVTRQIDQNFFLDSSLHIRKKKNSYHATIATTFSLYGSQSFARFECFGLICVQRLIFRKKRKHVKESNYAGLDSFVKIWPKIRALNLAKFIVFCTAVKNTSEKKLYKNNPNLNRFSLFGGCIFFFLVATRSSLQNFFFFRFIFSILHGMADLFVLFSLGTVVSDAAHTTVLLYIYIYITFIYLFG